MEILTNSFFYHVLTINRQGLDDKSSWPFCSPVWSRALVVSESAFPKYEIILYGKFLQFSCLRYKFSGGILKCCNVFLHC